MSPRSLHLLLDAQPLGEIHLAAVDAGEEIADGVDAKPPVLKLCDELQPLDVGLAVKGHATPYLGRHQGTARLVEADRAAGHAGCGRELVDRVAARLGGVGRRRHRDGDHAMDRTISRTPPWWPS